MLLNAHRRILGSRGFRLPDWIRGPLSLNTGCLSWCVINAGTMPIAIELIITNFHPKHWADLWRLEIETFDKIGTLSKIIELLNKNNMEILAAEGCVNTPGGLHSMSFIVSCIGYESQVDGSSEYRRLKTDVFMRDFYNWMAVKFIDVLSFATGERPRLKVSRMNSHRNLDLCVSNSADYHLVSEAIEISGSYMDLGPTEIDYLKDNLGRTIYYTPTVDTKNRFIRILLFGKHLSAPMYFQFISVRSHTFHMEQITEVFSRYSCNIVKFSMRQGSKKPASDQTILGKDAYCRLDLTFEPPGRIRDRSELQEFLLKKITDLSCFRNGDIQVNTHRGVEYAE